MGESLATRRRWLEWTVAISITIAMLWVFALGPAFDRMCGTRDGFADAQADLKAGRLRLQVGGYKNQRWRLAATIAQEQFGVELINTGCVPTDYKSSYSAAYNAEMEAELARHTPKASLETIWAEAERLDVASRR
jgi:hypothetical protein